MKVLVVGGGGREHALAWKIGQSPMLSGLSFTDPNVGFSPDATIVEGDPVHYAAEQGIDLVVVGPEAPLVDGIVDRLAERGILAFGPSAAAAQLEGSKRFAKAFMDRHGIPTAAWSSHTEAASAHKAVEGACVVKADGLAAGKGVVVADTAEQAHAAIDETFGGRFGEAGQTVVIEERLEGPEVSILALCDGTRAVPLLPCRDHKRRFEGDLGPNTGGMGAICPAPDVSQSLVERVHRTILEPTVAGLAEEGMPYRGVLYCGLMLTKSGPKVLEFNVRFGDPECQPLMYMLDQDLLPLLWSAASGQLNPESLWWKAGVACTVVMVAGDYPGSVPRGMPITGVADAEADPDVVVFFAGARRSGAVVEAAGGRVLGVTAGGPDLDQARERVYAAVQKVHFQTGSWRQDIGA